MRLRRSRRLTTESYRSHTTEVHTIKTHGVKAGKSNTQKKKKHNNNNKNHLKWGDKEKTQLNGKEESPEKSTE